MLDQTVNPLLKQHSGEVNVVDIDDSSENRIAWISMGGGCQGCAGAKYTLNLIISTKIKEFDDSIKEVLDITDHSNKANAFYKE